MKYATTGELPPNSKGGAFIHDPKLCGEKEVLAQVKLAFKSTGGSKLVVTRSLQLTVKKTTRSSKTLEGTLVCNNNGERTTVSSKVADLDEVVPRELGVSQAILDAVIFCHQDESLWPMSEPSALKKRFDEIFEAMRYTKAIDNLKVLKKKQGEKLTQFKIHEEQDKINKEKGERAERHSQALAAQIEELRTNSQEYTSRMEELEALSKEKHEQANSFLAIVHDLKHKWDQLRFRQDTVDELKDTLELMEEDEEWLQNSLAQYEHKVEQIETQIAQKLVLNKEVQDQLSFTRKTLQTRLAEHGKHQSDKEQYQRQLRSRVEMIRDASRIHAICGFDGEIDDEQVAAFHSRIFTLLENKKAELAGLQRMNREEVDKITAVITKLEGERASKTQDRVSAKNRMSAIEKRVNSLLNQIGTLNADEGALAVLETSRRELDKTLKEEKFRTEQAGWDEQIQVGNRQLVQLEAENTQLGSELVECTRLASERAQLDLRRKEQAERKRRLETLINTWKEKIDTVIDGAWEAINVDKRFLTVVNSHEKVLEDCRRRRDALTRDVEQNEFKLSSLREERRKKSAASAAAKKKVLDAMARNDCPTQDIEAYHEEVEGLDNQIQGAEKDLALFGALDKYYTQCSQTLERSDKCRLCERSFKDQGDAKTKLREKIQKLLNPAQKDEIQADIDVWKPMLKDLRNAQSDYDTYKRVSTEVPILDMEIKSLECDRDNLGRRLEDKDRLVKDAEDKQRDVDAMNKTVISIAQLAEEVRDGETQISRLETQQASFAGSRSAEEIHELQTEVGDKIRAVKKEVSKWTTEKQRARESVSRLELERSELTNKMNTTESHLQRKRDLQTQVESLKEDQNAQRDIITRADEELQEIDPEISKARQTRDSVLETGRAKEQTLIENRDHLASSISNLKMIDTGIQDYVERGAAAAMAANQQTIKELEVTTERLERETDDGGHHINELRQEIANSDRRRKNINDNLTYKKNLKVLAKLKEEIEELESRNATTDYDRLEREAKRYELEYTRVLAERSSAMGSMKTKDEELRRLLDEWDLDYKDADRKYRESHIKVETTKAAIEDLSKFVAALDKAIMEYHKRKMEDINRIAGELWQSTYQGTDIDTILIRSDAENSRGNRSYNYRVCMVKQETEMDMRGRCSAGQKVLASIIIRLALAESFGVNCGLIALDEPTTNLDRDNIRSLAASLHAIIRARQQQSNFQLIVITHDEEFLRHMKCGDFCDTFCRVTRNQRQQSVIGIESISKVSET